MFGLRHSIASSLAIGRLFGSETLSKCPPGDLISRGMSRRHTALVHRRLEAKTLASEEQPGNPRLPTPSALSIAAHVSFCPSTIPNLQVGELSSTAHCLAARSVSVWGAKEFLSESRKAISIKKRIKSAHRGREPALSMQTDAGKRNLSSIAGGRAARSSWRLLSPEPPKACSNPDTTVQLCDRERLVGLTQKLAESTSQVSVRRIRTCHVV